MRQSRLSVWRLAVVSAGIMVALIVSAVPASAHVIRAWVVTPGGTSRGFAEVYDNHLSLAGCDTRADGVGVYARAQLRNGQIIDVPDSNGSASGCGRATVPSTNPIVRIKAIYRGGAESGWVTA